MIQGLINLKPEKISSESLALDESDDVKDLPELTLTKQNAYVPSTDEEKTNANKPQNNDLIGQRRNGLVGGPIACDKEALIRFKTAVMHLRRQGVLAATFRPYTENVVSC